jgi:hypothetical protein
MGGIGAMGLGIAQPWMLPWLAAVVVPIVLAWLAMRRPRPVRFGPTEFVARAARRQLVTRGGVSLPLTAVRVAAVAVAALAAARPFTTALGRPAGAAGTARAVPRVECVVDDVGGDHDATRDVRRALEALREVRGHVSSPGRTQVAVVTPAAAGRDASTAPMLFIVGDGTVPDAAAARQIATAVSDGAAVLICIGPRSMAKPVRGRLGAWLDDLTGVTLSGGPVHLAGAGIAVAPEVLPGQVDAAGFSPLPGPTVDVVAPLMVAGTERHDIGRPKVLARTLPQELPLLVEVRRGRGAACIAALPLSLPERSVGAVADLPWSDLAAWPVFVPLVDQLVERLQTTAAAAGQTAGPKRLPLGPLLIALACGLLLADWALSRATSGGGHRGLQVACRAAAGLGWLSALFGVGLREPAGADASPMDPSRGIVVVLDRSPSMGRIDQETPGPLDRAVAALRADDGNAAPFTRLARSRPVDLVTVAADTVPLGRWGRDVVGRDLAALATEPPAARASRIGDAVADVARGAVTGSRPASIVVVSDGAITAGRDWSEAASIARGAGVPLIVVPAVAAPVAVASQAETPSPLPATDRVRVLLVDSGPRFEWRFLERALEADAGFAVQTCFLAPPEPAARGRRRLPGTVAEWNEFDVVVIGDVPLGPPGTAAAESHDEAWRRLAEAASADGLGIAWSPGQRWWRDAPPGPTWLPAAPAGARGPIAPYRLRVRAGDATGAWLPEEPVDAEVFAVLRPVTLTATARVLAAAVPAVAAASDAEPAPAIVVDRIGAGTVLAHLCETWRWRSVDAAAYEAYWRGLLRRLAEPHRLGAKYVATLDVVPQAAEAGELVRVEAVPTRADVDLSGWQLEIVAADATAPELAGRRVPLVPAGTGRGVSMAVIDGLGVGTHAVRLLPPANQASPPAEALPAAEIVVTEPMIERPGGRTDIGPLIAAARKSAGAVLSIDEIAALPSVVAALLPEGDAALVAGGETVRRQWLPLRAAAHAAMFVAVAALAAAWWPASRFRGGASARW